MCCSIKFFFNSFSIAFQTFDKEVKSFTFALEGSVTTTRMQIPKDAKQSCKYVLLVEF